MSFVNLDTCLRSLAVALVAATGLLASTPNLHGTADTRGGAACDVNQTSNPNCGDTGYQGSCLYLYTVCSAKPGWRFMTCVLKPLANNQCEKDIFRCFPQDDYMATGGCTPTYSDQSTVPPSRSG